MVRTLTISAFILIGASTNCFGQQINKSDSTRNDKKSWLTIGQGYARIYPMKGTTLSAVLDVSFSIKDNFGRAGIDLDMFSLNDFQLGFNAAYGLRLHHGRWSHLSGFIGPSYVRAENDGESHNTIGITGTIQMIFKPVSMAGLGLSLYGQANPIFQSFGIRGVLFFSNGK